MKDLWLDSFSIVKTEQESKEWTGNLLKLFKPA